jgi:hypothetical protein
MPTAGELYGRPWSEREHIIALHYYFLHENEPRHSACDHIQSLARLLGRTPGAVLMRLENYSSIDPSLEGKRVGLAHINALGRRVFDEWHLKRDALKLCAEAFIRDQKAEVMPSLFDPTPVRIPRAFDRYELVDHIGTGGSGTVFSCIEVNTQQLFAIKIIQADKLYDDETLHRFRREIRALKSREHQNIIRLHEDNLDSERHFPAYVMDFGSHWLTSYADQTARQQMTRNRPVLSPTLAKQILDSVFDAVHSLHTSNPRLIHRDINPNNVLRLRNGVWVLADFGLAKFITSAPFSTSFKTTTQRGWGTEFYTAPEQYHSFLNVDERTDVYSLGMLIWELFTTTGPPPDREHHGLSDSLAQVYKQATHRDLAARFQSVADLRSAFETAFADLAST